MFIVNRLFSLVACAVLASFFLTSISNAESEKNTLRTAHFASIFEAALATDDATIVKTLLNKGMSPNQKDTKDDPLLFDAASGSRRDKSAKGTALKIMQLLIDAKADINTQDVNLSDWTVLDTLVVCKSKAGFDILMEHKPDLTLEDDAGNTALDYAEDENKYESSVATAAILKILQDANAPHGDRLQSIHSTDNQLVAHVTNFSVDATTGIATITGIVTNLGKQHYTYVEIGAKFIEYTQMLIDTGLDNVASLDPGETWRFKVTTLKEGATGYKLQTLSGHS